MLKNGQTNVHDSVIFSNYLNNRAQWNTFHLCLVELICQISTFFHTSGIKKFKGSYVNFSNNEFWKSYERLNVSFSERNVFHGFETQIRDLVSLNNLLGVVLLKKDMDPRLCRRVLWVQLCPSVRPSVTQFSREWVITFF